MTGRQAPSVINAVFQRRQFWDGRAKDTFDGREIAGVPSQSRMLMGMDNGDVTTVALVSRLLLRRASLASQSVGPPMSGVEAACEGRTWPKLGKKMLGGSVGYD